MRDKLIELIDGYTDPLSARDIHNADFAEKFADYLLAEGVIAPPCKAGDDVWVVEREDGEAIDVSCVRYLAKCKNCVIATAFINDYDFDETLEYHISETQERFDTDLKVYPEEDCFSTREEAERTLKGAGDEQRKAEY